MYLEECLCLVFLKIALEKFMFSLFSFIISTYSKKFSILLSSKSRKVEISLLFRDFRLHGSANKGHKLLADGTCLLSTITLRTRFNLYHNHCFAYYRDWRIYRPCFVGNTVDKTLVKYVKSIIAAWWPFY